MPASMISADTGGSVNVTGSSIAMVATGPMPGSTPISVPSSTPKKQYSRLVADSATPKPMPRLVNNSPISLPSCDDALAGLVHRARAQREREAKALDEDDQGEDAEADDLDHHLLELELG